MCYLNEHSFGMFLRATILGVLTRFSKWGLGTPVGPLECPGASPDKRIIDSFQFHTRRIDLLWGHQHDVSMYCISQFSSKNCVSTTYLLAVVQHVFVLKAVTHTRHTVRCIYLISQATTRNTPQTKCFYAWEKSFQRFCNWDDTHTLAYSSWSWSTLTFWNRRKTC